MRSLKIAIPALGLLAWAGVTTCSDKSPTANSGNPEIAAVKVEPARATLSVNEKEQLTAIAIDEEGNPLEEQRFTWQSSDPDVATVSSSGLVTARSAGQATITASSNGETVNSQITVTSSSTPPPTSGDGGGEGIWLSREEIRSLPTSGPAWSNLKKEADSSCGTPELSNQDDDTNVCIMAKALVFARLGESRYRDAVTEAIRSIVNSGTYNGRALALGRELGAYVIAADLIDLRSHDASLDQSFRAKIRELLTTSAPGGGVSSLVECDEKRPNNWGNHCGASRAAVAAYLGDKNELERTARVFRGYLGDRSAYADFDYGDDLSWQCDPSKPVGINPAGCTRNGHSIDGVLPDDQRRGGSFSWPPPKENYVYEGLQGALAQAWILSRQGYDTFQWSDRALLRAFRWLHEQANFTAEGDDTWQPHLVNRVYGTNFPAPTPARAGKNVGWTDWTHAR